MRGPHFCSTKSKLIPLKVKVVIITDLGQRQNQHKMLKNITDLPETLQVPSLCFFSHNLEPQNAGLVDVYKDLN